jgi:hypothetical protein
VTKVFGVSTTPPHTEVFDSLWDVWNRGTMIVRGNAFDRNGID